MGSVSLLMPSFAKAIAIRACEENNIPVAALMSDCRKRRVADCRQRIFYEIKEARRDAISMTQIGRWFDRDPKVVMHGIACHAEREGLPTLVGYDLERAVRRNRLRARLCKRRRK